MNTWLWLLIVMILLIRGNRANIRADKWRRVAETALDHFKRHSEEDPFPERTSSRVDRVNEKLRDRCLALEKQNTELQSELNKRDRMIQKPKVKQKRQAI